MDDSIIAVRGVDAATRAAIALSEANATTTGRVSETTLRAIAGVSALNWVDAHDGTTSVDLQPPVVTIALAGIFRSSETAQFLRMAHAVAHLVAGHARCRFPGAAMGEDRRP